MKKLKLKALSLGAKEILSREQLKAITGGCVNDDDCPGGWCDLGMSMCDYWDDNGSVGSGGSSNECGPFLVKCHNGECKMSSDECP